MNPRRVHSLFLKHYPKFDLVECEWIHLYRDGAIDCELLRQMLSTIGADALLIHLHRKFGDYLPVEQAFEFIVQNMCKGTFRITDRAFTNVVVVGSNGVGATWPRCLTRSQLDALN
jgi:hypothetical protein